MRQCKKHISMDASNISFTLFAASFFSLHFLHVLHSQLWCSVVSTINIGKCFCPCKMCDNMWITLVIPSLHRKHYSVWLLLWSGPFQASAESKVSQILRVTCVASTTRFQTIFIFIYRGISGNGKQRRIENKMKSTGKKSQAKFERIFLFQRKKIEHNKQQWWNKSQCHHDKALLAQCSAVYIGGKKKMRQIIIFGDGKSWWWHDTYRVKVAASRFAYFHRSSAYTHFQRIVLYCMVR